MFRGKFKYKQYSSRWIYGYIHPIYNLQHSSTVGFSPIGPEWRWEHWQVVPGPPPARQTVPDLTAGLATRGLEPERGRHTRHQLRPAVCSSQARTRSVLSANFSSISSCSMFTHFIRSRVHQQVQRWGNLSDSSQGSNPDTNRKSFLAPQQGVIERRSL